ncbi:MAG: hypothetical protein DI533_22230 [Cereibacter sphaeroides]|uniref:Tyr recombinase domain-containing protein n=1 Tax=Cereibacter sphaeroides TaxID=1063 RepID=A0A2W5S300_CERSP|nr:MAG: hypothetical protein DI533_22230 [Cereibacter sphaeroides]
MFRLMMLTGQRRGEVLNIDWTELDRVRSEWLLPAEKSKNGRGHLISLSSESRRILDTQAGGKKWPASGLVFRSSRGTRLSGFSKIKRDWDQRIDRKLWAEDAGSVRFPWRLHDIRRTVATGMQTLGVRTEVIEAVLNHQSGLRSGLVSTYQRYDYHVEKAEAMALWGAHVAALTNR